MLCYMLYSQLFLCLVHVAYTFTKNTHTVSECCHIPVKVRTSQRMHHQVIFVRLTHSHYRYCVRQGCWKDTCLALKRTKRYTERKTERKLLIFKTVGVHKSAVGSSTDYGRKEGLQRIGNK